MQSFQLQDIRKAIADLKLNGANREVTDSWLSVWREARPPGQATFLAACSWEHIPAIAIFEVRKGISLRCLNAGSFWHLALGYDLSGQDVMAITPAGDREARLDGAWEIADGAVSARSREYLSQGSRPGLSQEVSLPLSGTGKDDARYFAKHINWRPVNDDWVKGTVKTDVGSSGVAKQAALFSRRSTIEI